MDLAIGAGEKTTVRVLALQFARNLVLYLRGRGQSPI